MHTSWNEGGQDYELCVSGALWEQWACMCGAFLSFCQPRTNSAKKEKLSVHERWSTRCMLNVEWETALLTIIITYYDDNHFSHSNFFIFVFAPRARVHTHTQNTISANKYKSSKFPCIHDFDCCLCFTFLCAFSSLNRCKCRCALCDCRCRLPSNWLHPKSWQCANVSEISKQMWI